jgi:hypothetical protein
MQGVSLYIRIADASGRRKYVKAKAPTPSKPKPQQGVYYLRYEIQEQRGDGSIMPRRVWEAVGNDYGPANAALHLKHSALWKQGKAPFMSVAASEGKHLVNSLADLDSYGVAFVSLRDNLDLSTPSGRLMFQIIGAMAEFERSLIQERVRAGLRNAKLKGKTLGRPRRVVSADEMTRLREQGASLREIAKVVGVSYVTVRTRLLRGVK